MGNVFSNIDGKRIDDPQDPWINNHTKNNVSREEAIKISNEIRDDAERRWDEFASKGGGKCEETDNEIDRLLQENSKLKEQLKGAYVPKELERTQTENQCRSNDKYWINIFGDYQFGAFNSDVWIKVLPTLKGAKSACQADYERRWIEGGRPAMEENDARY